jgi:hypothetical protein
MQMPLHCRHGLPSKLLTTAWRCCACRSEGSCRSCLLAIMCCSTGLQPAGCPSPEAAAAPAAEHRLWPPAGTSATTQALCNPKKHNVSMAWFGCSASCCAGPNSQAQSIPGLRQHKAGAAMVKENTSAAVDAGLCCAHQLLHVHTKHQAPADLQPLAPQQVPPCSSILSLRQSHTSTTNRSVRQRVHRSDAALRYLTSSAAAVPCARALLPASGAALQLLADYVHSVLQVLHQKHLPHTHAVTQQLVG